MAIYTTQGIERRYLTEGHLKKASAARLKPAPLDQAYDVFLSHSLRSDTALDMVRNDLVAGGHTVYVDKYEDPDLDPAEVSSETAERLRVRLRHCKSLVVAYTPRVHESRWVPWELGYADGYGLRVAVLPVENVDDEAAAAQAMIDVCDRQEFMGLYPYLSRTPDETGKQRLFVNNGEAWIYMTLRAWLSGTTKFKYDRSWLLKTLLAA
jgi:hypothetical protein